MFDYHMHSAVSFDSSASPEEMVRAAQKAGLREICFTDHLDYGSPADTRVLTFSDADYSRAYDRLEASGLLIRRGMEFGMTPDNPSQLAKDAARRAFDFVLGSVHFVDGLDLYYPEYWQGRTAKDAFRRYLEETLACVRVHDGYDVLAHLTYISKTPDNPGHEPLRYEDFQEISDEILKELVRRGKGLELNTSGVDVTGDFLPPLPFLRRFRELGGEIVTIGSDAHGPNRVGQYAGEALELLREVFGYVCTFEGRKPVFHKL